MEKSLFQDGKTWNRCCMYRIDQNSKTTVWKIRMTIDEYGSGGTFSTSSHHGDLERGQTTHTHKRQNSSTPFTQREKETMYSEKRKKEDKEREGEWRETGTQLGSYFGPITNRVLKEM